jgi:hypothetical protein
MVAEGTAKKKEVSLNKNPWEVLGYEFKNVTVIYLVLTEWIFGYE